MKRNIIIICLLACVAALWAQGPNGTGTYYQAADGKKGAALKEALYNILRYSDYTFVDENGYTQTKQYTMVPYEGLYDAYEDTDLRPDGYIWDMYSNTSNYLPSDHTGSYNCEMPGPAASEKTPAYMYSCEHVVVQSWFDGTKGRIPYSDLFNVYPVDAFINNKRSNYPLGEVGYATYESHNAFSKVGACVTPGYNGSVFEPNDIYKGDFARTFFYMATCHQDIDFTKTTEGANVFCNGDAKIYPTLQTWALNMFLKWAHHDEVSEKELHRNEAVSKLQYNRNPFIDYPGLEQYIWGSMRDVPFSYDNYQVPEVFYPDDSEESPDEPATGEVYLYKRVTSIEDLEEGASYIIVCDEYNAAMSEQNYSIRASVDLTTSNGAVRTEVNVSGKPYEVTLGKSGDNYTLYDATGQVYLAHIQAENKLHTATSVTATGVL